MGQFCTIVRDLPVGVVKAMLYCVGLIALFAAVIVAIIALWAILMIPYTWLFLFVVYVIYIGGWVGE